MLLETRLGIDFDKIGSYNQRIFLHTYQHCGKNQNTLIATIEMIFEPSICVVPTNFECPQRSCSNLNMSMSHAIHGFEEFSDCSCTLLVSDLFEDKCSESKLVLEIQGISATFFESGDSENDVL